MAQEDSRKFPLACFAASVASKDLMGERIIEATAKLTAMLNGLENSPSALFIVREPRLFELVAITFQEKEHPEYFINTPTEIPHLYKNTTFNAFEVPERMEQFGTGLENAILIATTKNAGRSMTAERKYNPCVSHFVAVSSIISDR